MKHIPALTIDLAQDGWETSRGFIKRDIEMPTLDETTKPEDAISVIVKVEYAGVCGSDRGIWNRNSFTNLFHESLGKEQKSMRILGHEFVGEVVEAGSLVSAMYDIHVGNPVSGDSHVTCGKCFQCRMGEQEVCQDQKILGISTDGIFATYVKIPAKNLWVVDFNRVRKELCALYDPFGNAVHCLTKVDVRGARVAIFGAGQIGMFAILLARQFGAAKVIAIDVNPEQLAIAKKLGAHETILIEKTDKVNAYDADKHVIDRIMELTYGKGVDVSLEMSGYNSSVVNSIEATRAGGDVIWFGIKDGDMTIPQFSRVIVKGLTIHNVIGRQIFQTWQTAQRVLSDKTNGIQEKMWNIIMKEGNGTVIKLSEYTPEMFEEKLKQHPKLVFDMQN